VLDLVCLNKMTGTDLSESRVLLSQLADLAQHHKRNPHMPGTIEKFASIVPELHSMADSMSSSQSPVVERKTEDATNNEPAAPPRPTSQQQQDLVPYPYHQSTTNSGAYMFADNVPGHFYPEQPPTNGAYSNARYDRSTQMNFMDFTISNINEWNWGDLGNLIGNEAAPSIHPHMHAPPGPPPGPG
jgi:hypothetical protein